MIYLHTDKKYRPDRWFERFEKVLTDHEIAYRKVNLRKRNPLGLAPRKGDGLLGRYAHHTREMERMKPIYAELANQFGGRIFPQAHTYHYYDDKRLEAELLAQHDYPTPLTAYVESPEQVEEVLATTGLTFPLVTKKIGGAGSSGVALAHTPREIFAPGVIQEFCPGNEGDWRIYVIGNRIMGFHRLNRENDFRASGSGKKHFASELPRECVELAWKISQQHDFESMAYDFVRNQQGEWVVLEFSYTYVDAAVAACEYYYDMPSGERRAKPDLWPQDFIVEDFLNRHPELELSRRSWWNMSMRRSA